MDTNSIQQITELYNRYFSPAIAIRDIFIDHFGEENVDFTIPTLEVVTMYLESRPITVSTLYGMFRNASIIVKFPEVTITNENGNSVDVKNIFVNVPITIIVNSSNENDIYCVMTNAFTMSRSHYTESHIISDYMHSHVNGLPLKDGHEAFLSCCLGSGPIRSTISTLCAEYNLSMWELFCFELDNYVHTESLSGGPWRRMSSISTTPYTLAERDNTYYTYHSLGICDELYLVFKDFIPYFIKTTKIPFCYVDGSYMIALPYLDFVLLLSNKFIDWINIEDNPYRSNLIVETLYNTGTLNTYVISDNKINALNSSNRNYANIIEFLRDKNLFMFKGNQVRIEIERDINNVCTPTTLLSYKVTGYIATLITKSANYFYGNKHYEAANTDTATGCKFKFI